MQSEIGWSNLSRNSHIRGKSLYHHKAKAFLCLFFYQVLSSGKIDYAGQPIGVILAGALVSALLLFMLFVSAVYVSVCWVPFALFVCQQGMSVCDIYIFWSLCVTQVCQWVCHMSSVLCACVSARCVSFCPLSSVSCVCMSAKCVSVWHLYHLKFLCQAGVSICVLCVTYAICVLARCVSVRVLPALCTCVSARCVYPVIICTVCSCLSHMYHCLPCVICTVCINQVCQFLPCFICTVYGSVMRLNILCTGPIICTVCQSGVSVSAMCHLNSDIFSQPALL